MSYYTIRPSNRVSTGNGTMYGQNAQNPDPMRPLLQTPGGFRTRDVNPNELSSNQLNQITDENGAYIQRARNAGLAQANSRGLLNSSMAAGAAQGAAIDAAMPMAMQQAGAYTNVGDRNMDAENSYLLQRDALNNARNIADSSNATSLNIAGMENDERMRQFDEGTRRYDQGYNEDLRRYDTDWTREQERDATANTNARNNYTFGRITDTIFSDPSIWRDGPGAIGFANYYGQNFGSLWDSIIGSS